MDSALEEAQPRGGCRPGRGGRTPLAVAQRDRRPPPPWASILALPGDWGQSHSSHSRCLCLHLFCIPGAS